MKRRNCKRILYLEEAEREGGVGGEEGEVGLILLLGPPFQGLARGEVALFTLFFCVSKYLE